MYEALNGADVVEVEFKADLNCFLKHKCLLARIRVDSAIT